MKTLTITTIALSAAMMLPATAAFAADTTTAPMVNCKGVNACKGQGSCKSSMNSCKGTNSCKGKGVMSMTADDCTKAGGTVDTDAATTDTTTGN